MKTEEGVDRPTSMSLKGNCALKPLCNVGTISKDLATRDSKRSTNTGTGLRAVRVPKKACLVCLLLFMADAFGQDPQPRF